MPELHHYLPRREGLSRMPCGTVVSTPSAFGARIGIKYVFPCEILYFPRSEVVDVLRCVFEIDRLKRPPGLEILKKDVRNSREYMAVFRIRQVVQEPEDDKDMEPPEKFVRVHESGIAHTRKENPGDSARDREPFRFGFPHRYVCGHGTERSDHEPEYEPQYDHGVETAHLPPPCDRGSVNNSHYYGYHDQGLHYVQYEFVDVMRPAGYQFESGENPANEYLCSADRDYHRSEENHEVLDA